MDFLQISQRPIIIRLAGLGLVLLTVLGLLLIALPQTDKLDKYQALYSRGEYKVCAAELTKLLKKNPNWHEARELQIQAFLADEQPFEALRSLLILMGKGIESPQEDTVLERLTSEANLLQQSLSFIEENLGPQAEFDRARTFLIELQVAFSNPNPDPQGALNQLIILAKRSRYDRYLEKMVVRMCSDAHRYLGFLDQTLEEEPELTWAREMKLQIALEHLDYREALAMFKEVMEAGSLPKDLTSQTWLAAQRQGNIPALEFALLLNRPDWVKAVLDKVELSGEEGLEQLPALLELLPDEPRLLQLKAFNADNPRDGLDILLDLEAAGYVPANPAYYGEQKFALLQQIGRLEPSWLQFVPHALFVEQVILWQDSRAKGLVDWLESNASEDMADETDMLRQITTYKGSPKIVWFGTGSPTDLSISPNGHWLLSSSPAEMTFVNLNTGIEYAALPVTGNWSWSPDSTRAAAVEAAANLNTLYFYTPMTSSETLIPSTVEIPLESALANPELLGWLDNSTLLLSGSSGDNLRKVVQVDVKTGEIKEESEPKPGWPMLASDRTLAWVWHKEGKLCIDQGNGVKRYDIEPIIGDLHLLTSPLDWFPGNDKLLMQAPYTPTTAYSLNLASGEISSLELPLFYRPGNWADSKNIFGILPLWKFGTNYKVLVKVNLETGITQYAGVNFSTDGDILYSSQGNLVVIAHENGTAVYKIP